MLAAILLLLAALTVWVLWANRALVTTETESVSARLPEGFDGFRIAQVSDLHNAEFGAGNEKLLERLRRAEPDIIVITGDLVDSRRTDISAAAAFAEAACDIAPVYYVTGNHEARLDFEEDIEPALSASGVRVLRNEAVYLERGGARIMLAGMDDPGFTSGGTAAERARSELERLPETEIYTVLLAHRPELIETYADYGADLVLSGHAHGGQVRLPFAGGLFAPGQGLFPEYDAGLYEYGGTDLVVSRGLGNSLFPLRFNNRPELVVITLKSGAPCGAPPHFMWRSGVGCAMIRL